MARYNLTAPQRQILTSWLFEADGYLESAVNSSGQSARQALAATSGLDITVWIRTNTAGPTTIPSNWTECGMVWWMRSRDGVNITGGNRPPEAAAWQAILNGWTVTIDEAFGRAPQEARDQRLVPITAEDGSVTTMPAGQQLAHQKNLIAAVLGVL